MLFFGGVEYFLVDELDRGIKKYVVEKDRRKEIQDDLKGSMAILKAFNKERASKLKLFKRMNADRHVAKKDLEKFYDDRHKERVEFQQKVINERLKIIVKLNEEEWENIVSMSAENVAKSTEKAKKKKQKDPYAGLINSVSKTVENKDLALKVATLVKNFENKHKAFNDQLKSMNILESKVVQKQDATFEELESMAKAGNNFRKEAFDAFLDFHQNLKNLTTEREWNKIMKEFNKIIN
jgi:hypothetical protein